MANTFIKNSIFYEINNAKDSVPASSTGTGTIATQGNAVVGTGTIFKRELQKGAWVVDLAQNEVRQVIDKESDTLVRLNAPFTVDISASSPLIYIPNTFMDTREISVIAITTDAILDGVALPAGLGVNMVKTGSDKEDGGGFVDPIIVDATGTIVKVIIQR